MISESIIIEAPFFDVDSCNIVWHGNYVKYFELARCQLLDTIGYNYKDMAKSGFTFPVVDLHVKYLRSVQFLQKIIVEAHLKEWEHKLIVDYLVKDANSLEKLTKGSTTQVAVSIEENLLHFDTPGVFQDKVQNLLQTSENKE